MDDSNQAPRNPSARDIGMSQITPDMVMKLIQNQERLQHDNDLLKEAHARREAQQQQNHEESTKMREEINVLRQESYRSKPKKKVLVSSSDSHETSSVNSSVCSILSCLCFNSLSFLGTC